MVKAGRTLLGATKYFEWLSVVSKEFDKAIRRPSESAPGSIRGDFCIDVGRNICEDLLLIENIL